MGTENWDIPSKSSVGKPLLPCPFCGGSALLMGESRPGRHGHEWIECGGDCSDSVMLGGCTGYRFEAPSHEVWNKRSAASIIGALPGLNGEELEAIADALVSARNDLD